MHPLPKIGGGARRRYGDTTPLPTHCGQNVEKKTRLKRVNFDILPALSKDRRVPKGAPKGVRPLLARGDASQFSRA